MRTILTLLALTVLASCTHTDKQSDNNTDSPVGGGYISGSMNGSTVTRDSIQDETLLSSEQSMNLPE